MTIEQLRRAHQATPFKPFDICLADGQRFHIPSPEYLHATPVLQRTIVVACPPDAYQIVDLLLVTCLEFDVKKKGRHRGGNGNGSSRRRT